MTWNPHAEPTTWERLPEYPSTKACTRCGREWPLEDYFNHPRGRFGKQSQCRECYKDKSRRHYQQNKLERVAASKRWREANPEKWAETKRRSKVKIKFGMEWGDYLTLLSERGEVCWICGATDPGRGRKSMCVDHDHGTGMVRGLLCFDCNDGIGRFRDDPELLRSAVRFLEGSDA